MTGQKPIPIGDLRLILRVLGRLERTESCWLWRGYCQQGYGIVGYQGKLFRVHRVLYLLFKGPIPEGLELDHLCRVRACANPDHLRAVTGWENTLAGNNMIAVHARKTHCHRGHAFTPENTYVEPRRPHARACVACHRIRLLAWREKHAAAIARATGQEGTR